MPKRSINSKNHPLFQLHTHRATSRRSSFSIVGDESDSPCVPDHSVISYFNTPAVRSAIGATHIGNPNGWQVCSTFINYTTIYTTMLPFYTKLLPQIRILVYSGDVDTVLNTLGTQAGINKLGLTVSVPYSQWLHNDVNGNPVVDGFYKKYSNGRGLTFVTVRGESETLILLRKLFIEQALQQENELGGVFDFTSSIDRKIVSEEKNNEQNSIITTSSSDESDKEGVENENHHKRKLTRRIRKEEKTCKKKKINDHDETPSEIDEEVIILTIQKQLDEEQASSSIRKGRRQLDYTLCEVHDDVPYTFHCHPIEIDRKTKLPINMANLIS
ncbi:predicted protein, partial [Naegleria gruberi]